MRDVAKKRRLVAVVGMLCLGVTVAALITVERKRSGLASEVEWLRTRLAERRQEIARQRQALTAVGGAVDRLARVALETRDRAGKARRLARLEPAHGTPRDPVQPVTAQILIADEAAPLVEQIEWLGDQMATTGQSIDVISALVENRTKRTSRGSVPSVWPLRGIVTSRFGQRRSPYGEASEMHGGIDNMSR